MTQLVEARVGLSERFVNFRPEVMAKIELSTIAAEATGNYKIKLKRL